MTMNDDLPREARSGPIFHPDWGTHAYAQYIGDVRELDALLAMVFPMRADTDRSTRYLTARRLRIENDSRAWAIDVRHAMLSWQVAMRVSAVEVYLQNALTFLAVYDAEFIRTRGSKQEWDYDAIRLASDNDDALWTFCSQWARSFVGDGGPQRWSSALRRAGLGEFDDSDLTDLEAMWGFRHMRVHHGGQFTRDFIRRHRDVADRLWREGLKESDLARWSEATERFAAAVEKGIAGRLKATIGPDLIDQRQNAEFERQLAAMGERHKQKLNEIPEDVHQARIDKAMTEALQRSALMAELFDDMGKPTKSDSALEMPDGR